MIQPQGVRVVVEDQCGPQLVFDKVMNLEDAWVINLFEDLEFAAGGAAARLPVKFRSVALNVIDSDPTFCGCELRICGRPVLIRVSRALIKQLPQVVNADTPRLPRRTYSGLLDCLAERSGQRAINHGLQVL